MTHFSFVFPGQGSQARGMMNGYADLSAVRDTFTEASDVLQQDLWHLVTEGADEELHKTTNTQPIMLTAGIAVYRAWKSLNGPSPALMAGHSLGEYTALVAAGAISFADALPLVRYRAECMQHAVPEGVGGMAAILGLDDDVVREVCAEGAQGDVLEAANFNSPGHVVVAGNRAALERGMVIAKAKGAKRAVMLAMSVPSHCSLQKGAAEQLRDYLKTLTIHTPSIPVYQNADVASYNDVEKIKDALVIQLYSPVRWVETLLAFGQLGMTHNVKCAPGKVLVGLNKRIDTNQHAVGMNDSEAIKAALLELA